MRGGSLLDASSEVWRMQVCHSQKLWVVAVPLCRELTIPVPREASRCLPAALVEDGGHGIPSLFFYLPKFLPINLCCPSPGQLAQGLPLDVCRVNGCTLRVLRD